MAVVRTPLQLLNAVEARYHFQFARPDLLILFSSLRPWASIQGLVDPGDWNSVTTFDIDDPRKPFPYSLLLHPLVVRVGKTETPGQIYRRRRLETAVARWRHVPNLVLGNYYSPYQRHIARMCSEARCILVDDGTDTLRIATRRHEKDEPTNHKPTSLRYRLYRRLAGWDDRQRDDVLFFSSYDLELPPGDELVANTFARTRARVRSTPRDGRCLFVGQPLVEDGYVTEETFLKAMHGVKDSLRGYDLQYVPHRRELPEKLARFRRSLEVPILSLGTPFEWHLIEAPTSPGAVASFFSSALDNCRLIFGSRSRLLAFRLTSADLLACHEFVADVYRYFEQRSREAIEVLDPGAAVSSGG